MISRKLTFQGDLAGLVAGIAAMSQTYGFSTGAGGLTVQVRHSSVNSLSVQWNGSNAILSYDRKIHFYRALGLLLEHLDDCRDYQCSETMTFASAAVMVDVAQGNAVPIVASIQDLLVRMAAMGLDRLMLYVEDNYVIEGEPFFGYMRGRYTPGQLAVLDDFAFNLGIEMIPCIQTLAHLIDALKWKCYSDIKDDDDTLLVGQEKTYQLIEKMITAASAPFRSKHIHLGMDEAWKLGQGQYLLQNGYREKPAIMAEHLERVLKITDRLGLQPMIWSDMYFRTAASGIAHYNLTEAELKAVRGRIPEGLGLVYWDYYHRDESFYRQWIRNHQNMNRPLIFAAGIWSWNSFAVDYDMTIATATAALNACRAEKVRDVMVTIWGDGGTESCIFANLLGLQFFAEQAYAPASNQINLASRFAFCAEGVADDYLLLTQLDRIPGAAIPDHSTINPSRYLLWQNVMLGLFDQNITGLDLNDHYRRLAGQMDIAATRNGRYGGVFTQAGLLCRVLAIKAELGGKIVAAYRAQDHNRLRAISQIDLAALADRVEDLRVCHRRLWHQINQPFGWEVLDIRYGGLQASLTTAVARIEDYLAGRVDQLEELAEERLPYDDHPGPLLCMPYSRMVSASRLTFSYGF